MQYYSLLDPDSSRDFTPQDSSSIDDTIHPNLRECAEDLECNESLLAVLQNIYAEGVESGVYQGRIAGTIETTHRFQQSADELRTLSAITNQINFRTGYAVGQKETLQAVGGAGIVLACSFLLALGYKKLQKKLSRQKSITMPGQ